MLTRALLATLLALTGCGGASGSPLERPQAAASPRAPFDENSPREGHREFTITVRLRMVTTGEAAFGPIEEEATLRVVEIWQGANPKELWFYSVSPAEPVALSDGRLVLFTADLSPGLYAGPGRYELSEEKVGVVLSGQPGVHSAAYVQTYLPATGGHSRDEIIASFRRFERFGAPCFLEVTADSMTGTVDCAELRDDQGRTVELHWNWERI